MTELFVALSALAGPDAVREVVEGVGLWREQLRASAAEVEAVGLTDLSAILRQLARKARPKPIEHRSYLERRAMRQRQKSRT